VRLPDDLRRQGFALMFVIHNLGLVPRIAQHVAVLAGP
jgi:ABC-type dipeptide/oligopeptide/nickel transport system ATPase component